MDAPVPDCALQDFGPPRVRKRRGGPSSAGGKKTVSQNARKHGCRSREKIIPGERRADYDALWEQWLGMYEPETPSDVAQLEQIVENAWRLRRAERAYTDIERELAGASKNAAEWAPELVHRLQLMQRYRTSSENSLHKAVRLVEFLKDKRAADRREREKQEELERARTALIEERSPEAAAMLRELKAEAAAKQEAERAARAQQLFRGQNCITDRQTVVPPLVQWVEIRITKDRTVTELSPSNEELMEQGKAMLPPPAVVHRRLNFPNGFPAEYDWVGVRDAEQRRRGGFGTQRMTVQTWVDLCEREAKRKGGHLLPTPNLPRPSKKRACDCPMCVTEAEMARRVFAEG